MLLRLFETSLLLEINLEKTKPRLRKLLLRGLQDRTFWKSFATLHGDAMGMSDAQFLRSYLIEPEAGGRGGADAANEIDYLIEQVYNRLLDIDPTKDAETNKHRYVNWLINCYIKDYIKLWEDMTTMGELLGRYDRLKVRQVFTRMSKEAETDHYLKSNDINNINGKYDLSIIVKAGEDWLKSNEEKDLTTEWLRYKHWSEHGGIEILWPQGKDALENIRLFSQTGAVIKLKTVEASVSLFQGPTSWCTARPGNEYFDQYTNGEDVSNQYDHDNDEYHRHDDGTTRHGGSPLFVIVDNVSDKLYQLHKSTGQYLDENDSTEFNPYKIPLGLMRVAAKALRFKNVGLLYQKMGVAPSHLLDTVTNYENEQHLMAGELWRQCVRKLVDIDSKQLDFVIHAYVEQHGGLPPAEEVKLVVNRMFGVMPQDDEEGIYADGYDLALSIILHYARKTNNLDIMKSLFDRVKFFRWLVIAFYSGTPLWAEARAVLVQGLMEHPQALHWMAPSTKSRNRFVSYRGALKPPPLDSVSAYAILGLNQQEVDALVRTIALRWPHDLEDMVAFFKGRKTPPSEEAMQEVLAIQHQRRSR